MNILFTCAGRRNYLIKYFNMLKDVRTIACDASASAPALYVADDFFIVPPVNDVNYTDILIDEATKRGIDAIIPLNDLELPVMATNKEKFSAQNIKVIVSDNNIIDICFDKYKTVKFSNSISLKELPTFLSPVDALAYKKMHPGCEFILKPRWGFASIGIEYLRDSEDLIYRYELSKKNFINSFLNEINNIDLDNCIIIQKYIAGQEYGMDVINNLEAEFEAVLLRKKIAMRAGETDKAETIYDDRLKSVGEEIGRKLKHIGNLDCDLFVDGDDIYLLEMNPRFGGGYPFMHFAGANLPLAIVKWLKGKETPVECFNYTEGISSAKVDEIVGLL